MEEVKLEPDWLEQVVESTRKEVLFLKALRRQSGGSEALSSVEIAEIIEILKGWL